MCILMNEPDAEWMAFLAQSEAQAPVYKYKRDTTVQYDQATGLVEVELGVEDMAVAIEACLDRMCDSEEMDLSARAGCERGDGQIDMDGALAEVAFARAIKSNERPATGTFKQPDIAGVQVRSTPVAANRLIVRPSDNPEDVFVLATGSGPLWTIRGGIVGKGARKVGHWYDGNGRDGAWFVSQSHLKTLDKSQRFGHLFANETSNETLVSSSTQS